jgi:hypothetical protein
MRHKPKYNNLWLTYVALDKSEQSFQANDITSSTVVTKMLGASIKDSGSRFITNSDIEFEIDGVIMFDGNTSRHTKRIVSLPDTKLEGNNSHRGYYRQDRIIVTT